MATSTPNYGLKKFESGDAPDLPSLAASMDKIDTELKKNETNIGLLDSGKLRSISVTNESVSWQDLLSSSYTSWPFDSSFAVSMRSIEGKTVLYGSKDTNLSGGFLAVRAGELVHCKRINGIWTYRAL